MGALGGGPPRREVWDVETLEASLAKQPKDAWLTYRLAFAKARGVFWDKETSFNHARGIPMVSVKQYLAEHF